MKNSDKWSSSSIPSTGFRIPDSAQSDSKEYGKFLKSSLKGSIACSALPTALPRCISIPPASRTELNQRERCPSGGPSLRSVPSIISLSLVQRSGNISRQSLLLSHLWGRYESMSKLWFHTSCSMETRQIIPTTDRMSVWKENSMGNVWA